MSEETSTPEVQPETNYAAVAAQHFGNGFKGEVVEIETPTETPEEPVEAAQETPELQEALETETPVEEAAQISTVQELIEQGEYDPEWFNSLKIGVKVDGKPSEASLVDLVNSYQIQEAAEKRLDESKEKARVQNQALAEKQEQIDNSLQVAAKLIEKVELKLTSDFQKIDWDSLEKNDPAEFAAQRIKLGERQNELAQMKQDAVSEYQRNAQGNQAQVNQSLQETLVSEQAALLVKIPEWNDAETAKTEKAKIGEYLLSQGHTQEEISSAHDHRIILMARKAMLYDAAQNAEPQKKKLAKVPRILKPGANPDPVNHLNQQISSLHAQMREEKSPVKSLEIASKIRKLQRQGNS